jgi:hypothetical protein
MNTLEGVSATGPHDVWAVGNCSDDYWDSYGGPRLTLVEHWDGTRWNIVSSPNPGIRHELSAVSAIAPDDAWAVGSQANHQRNLIDRTLAMHWDGKQWSDIPGPNPSNDHQHFGDVVAVSKDEIWAVGSVDRNVLAARFLRVTCPIP